MEELEVHVRTSRDAGGSHHAFDCTVAAGAESLSFQVFAEEDFLSAPDSDILHRLVRRDPAFSRLVSVAVQDEIRVTLNGFDVEPDDVASSLDDPLPFVD
jgi:hypothetical protein